MTEYWKSNPKHWCKECKVFLDAKESSIRHHEQGEKHQNNRNRNMWTMRKEREKKNKANQSLKDELRRIEEAARESFAVDVALGEAKKSKSDVRLAPSRSGQTHPYASLQKKHYEPPLETS
eukprot:207621_1